MLAARQETTTLEHSLRATWMSADYAHIARHLEPGALEYLARLAIAPGTRMLDAACGAGQLAIPAARAGARVIGIDIAPNLVAEARYRAWDEHLDATFDEGTAEALPYPDGMFDLVVSLIGVAFSPQPERVVSEFHRVCRPGGRIAMANWTPQGHMGQVLRILADHAPPDLAAASPLEWGVDSIVRHRLHRGFTKLEITKRMYPMHFPFAPSAVVEFFRQCEGPTNRAFAALDIDARDALRAGLERLWEANNRARDGSTRVEAEYLDIVATRGR